MATTFPEARLKAWKAMRYFGGDLMALIPVEKPGLGTMAVDQHWRCYYDQATLDCWTTEEAAGTILHELLHLLKLHHRRLQSVAGDHPTEEQLLAYSVSSVPSCSNSENWRQET